MAVLSAARRSLISAHVIVWAARLPRTYKIFESRMFTNVSTNGSGIQYDIRENVSTPEKAANTSNTTKDDCRHLRAHTNFVNSVVCSECGWLHEPPDSKTTPSAFAIFKIPISFDIEAKELKRRLKILQQKVHPDMHSAGCGKLADQQAIRAAQWSAIINNAYQILCEPYSRARHVLEKCAGIDLEHERHSENEGELLFVLETREEIADAVAEGDTQKLLEIYKRNRLMIEVLIDRLHRMNALELRDSKGAPEVLLNNKEREQIINIVSKMSYLQNIEHELLKHLDSNQLASEDL